MSTFLYHCTTSLMDSAADTDRLNCRYLQADLKALIDHARCCARLPIVTSDKHNLVLDCSMFRLSRAATHLGLAAVQQR